MLRSVIRRSTATGRRSISNFPETISGGAINSTAPGLAALVEIKSAHSTADLACIIY